MRSLHLVRISLFVLACALQLSWAQRRAAAPVNPNSTPIRNVPDPTGQAHLEYHRYDKTPLSFKSSAIYVLVPAVVTDKNGNHVTGLTASDFRIQENGKDQKVSSVEEAKPIAEISLTASHRENEFSNQTPSDSKARQLVIIALDMINTPYSDQTRARGQLISYLSESIEPGCLYQLVAIEDNGLRVLHDYTQDTGALIAALRQAKSRLSSKNTVDTEALQFAPTDVGVTAQSSLDVNPYTGRPDVENMLEFAGERAYAQMKEGIAAQATLAAFQQIAEGVSGIPGRKSLVWITGSFPFSIDPATASVNTGLAFEAYQHTMRLLEQQMISVYPVDARGLLLTQPDASMRLSGSQIARASTLTADLSNRLLDTLETMRAFADMTGGRAYVNTNDTRSAVRDAVRDGSAYYILTYAADKSNVRPGWRQIKSNPAITISAPDEGTL
jgi:VWFA-related protein